jgi:hypothetical protein
MMTEAGASDCKCSFVELSISARSWVIAWLDRREPPENGRDRTNSACVVCGGFPSRG